MVHPDFAVFAGSTPCMLNCIHAAYMCGTLVNNLVSVSLLHEGDISKGNDTLTAASSGWKLVLKLQF